MLLSVEEVGHAALPPASERGAEEALLEEGDLFLHRLDALHGVLGAFSGSLDRL